MRYIEKVYLQMGLGRPKERNANTLLPIGVTALIYPILCIVASILFEEPKSGKFTRDRFAWQKLVYNSGSNYISTFNPTESITFVTIPKPQIYDRQINMSILTLKVWLSYPMSKVVMVCSEESYDPTGRVMPVIRELYGKDCIEFIGDLPTGYEGRPLVREWFKAGMNHVKTGLVCFLNGDIIIPGKWMATAYQIFKVLGTPEKTLIYGTRSDVHDRPGLWSLDLTKANWVDTLAEYLHANKRCNNPYGMDVVLVHSSMTCLDWDELPDFVVGMCVWDNFFQGWANKRMETVTMNFNPELFHVDHAPNACNSSNYNYFRRMSYRSPHFNAFHEHHMARWKLDLENGVLRSRFRGEEKKLY